MTTKKVVVISSTLVLMVVIAGLAILYAPGTDEKRIELDGDQDLLDMAEESGWPGSGTTDDPIIIEGLDLNVSGGEPCFSLSNVHLNLLISNCQMTNPGLNADDQGVGMLLFDVTNVKVQGCVIHGGEVGLKVLSSKYVVIEGSEVHGGVHGLLMAGSSSSIFSNTLITGALNASYCDHNQLSNVSFDGMGANDMNNCDSNEFDRTTFNATESPGLRLIDSDDNHFDRCSFHGKPLGAGGTRGMIGLVLTHAHGSLITNCSMAGGGYMGIGASLIDSSLNEIDDCHLLGRTAFFLKGADDNIISENLLEGSVVGFDMHDCSGCSIINNSLDSELSVTGLQMIGGGSNHILDNILGTHSVSGFAIYLNGSSINIILGNSFVYLGEGARSTALGVDDTVGNAWNDSTGGNHWSDLTAPDDDDDGIIDTPYYLEGGSGATDHKPLAG